MPSVHALKCWPKQFAEIRRGIKTFEFRQNDRDFQVGDIIVLREFQPTLTSYTGQEMHRQITSMLSDGFGLPVGYVVLSIGAVVFADADPESRWIEDSKLSCPHCGGSGHRDDVAAHPAQAVTDVIAERRRQIEVEDFDASHDDMATRGQLATAAACYAFQAGARGRDFPGDHEPIGIWPWSREWWKPADPRRNLIKAAALTIAEIERLDRAAIAAAEGPKE